MQWPPTPGPGREAHEPERLRRRRVDDLPDVDAHPLAQQGQLVHEGDVDVAEDVLEQLGQLGRGRRAQARRPASLMLRRSAAARSVAVGVVPPTSRGTERVALAGSPGFTRSGAKARSKSRPATRPDRSSSSRNGPSVVPGNVVDWRTTSWPGRKPLADQGGGAQDRAEVGILGAGDRRGHAHEDRVGRRQVGALDRVDPEPGGEPALEPCVVDVVDRRAAGPQLLDPTDAGVDAGDREARLREGEGERQADVAEADDGHVACPDPCSGGYPVRRSVARRGPRAGRPRAPRSAPGSGPGWPRRRRRGPTGSSTRARIASRQVVRRRRADRSSPSRPGRCARPSAVARRRPACPSRRTRRSSSRARSR